MRGGEMIGYALPDGSTLAITDAVESHLLKHRQLKLWNREAGGQLFATFDGPSVVIREATGPRKRDRRGRWHYIPDRDAENAEIAERHQRGLHYVGDWNTHPQDVPSPSNRDLDSIRDCVKKSQHNLEGFILVIVGRLDPPAGLHVLLHDGLRVTALAPQ